MIPEIAAPPEVARPVAYPDWLDRKAYPFETRYFPLEAGRLHYVDEGAGEPVVMVHGNPTWSFLYREQIRRLAPDYRCVVPDHLGFGLSDKPPGWSYRPQDHARNLHALIDGLGLRGVTLVVQDWGGPIGLSYALQRPENVRRLVLLNTWMWPVVDERHFFLFSRLLGSDLGRFLIQQFNLFARVVMPLGYGDRAKLTPALHRHYLQPLDTPAKRLGTWVFPREILGATAWLRSLWAERAKLAEKPALLAWGMRDPAFRAQELDRWLTVFPQAEVERFYKAGHFVQEEADLVLALRIRRFLDTTA